MICEFAYYVNFGSGDYGDSCLEAEITEEEFERLKQACLSEEDFCDCESVKDIYFRIYDLADDAATADLKASEMLENGYNKASELYSISVDYPNEINEWYEEYDEDFEDD